MNECPDPNYTLRWGLEWQACIHDDVLIRSKVSVKLTESVGTTTIDIGE